MKLFLIISIVTFYLTACNQINLNIQKKNRD